MDKRHGITVIVDGVLDGSLDQTESAFLGDGFDADATGVGEADFAVAVEEGFLEKLLEGFDIFTAFGKFDACIDVFSVLTKDDHIDLFGCFDGCGHAGEIGHGSQADVEIKNLTQCDVEAADTTTHGRGEWAFDTDE